MLQYFDLSLQGEGAGWKMCQGLQRCSGRLFPSAAALCAARVPGGGGGWQCWARPALHSPQGKHGAHGVPQLHSQQENTGLPGQRGSHQVRRALAAWKCVRF